MILKIKSKKSWTDHIEEEVSEKWEISKAKVTKIFREKLGIEKDIIIERAHRTKMNYKDKDKKVPRTIKKLKGSGAYINRDFSR